MHEDLTERPRLREWSADVVQWGPARNGIKRGVHLYAGGRSAWLRARGQVPAVPNIFTGSCPKSGSQWAKALFDHEVVRRHTRLFTLPQLDYQKRAPRPFPRGTYVPGIYMSYDEFTAIPKPDGHRTVYVFRDPREIIVSSYFSAIETHRRIAGVDEVRAVVSAMPRDEGIHHCIDLMASRLREMASWVGVDDPAVATFRLEDIGAAPATQVPLILEHCAVRLDASELDILLEETSREALQRKDLAKRPPGSESHYRVRRESAAELLSPAHLAAIDAVVPGLTERLGYR